AKTRVLAGAGHVANLQRLVTQAVAVFQQQQVLVGQVAQLEQPRLVRQRVFVGYGEQERLLEQELAVQAVLVQRQGKDAGVEPALAQQAQDRLGLFLDQQQLQ